MVKKSVVLKVNVPQINTSCVVRIRIWTSVKVEGKCKKSERDLNLKEIISFSLNHRG